MYSTNTAIQTNIRTKTLEAIEVRGRRVFGRSAAFEYESAASAESAVANLTAIGARASVAYWGGGRFVLVYFSRDHREHVVDTALAAGGTYYDEGRRRSLEPHTDPTDDRDGYRAPRGFQERLGHIARIRDELKGAKLDIDYHCTDEGTWNVRIGALHLTVAAPPGDVEDQLGAIDEAERILRLVQRLMALLE